MQGEWPEAYLQHSVSPSVSVHRGKQCIAVLVHVSVVRDDRNGKKPQNLHPKAHIQKNQHISLGVSHSTALFIWFSGPPTRPSVLRLVVKKYARWYRLAGRKGKVQWRRANTAHIQGSLWISALREATSGTGSVTVRKEGVGVWAHRIRPAESAGSEFMTIPFSVTAA